MDAVHFHLIVNHIPILGSIFGALLLVIGMVLKNKTLEVTGLSTLLLAAVFTLPTYFSGEEAEHVVEKIAGISEHELEEHEEHAELSLWMMMVTGALSLLTLLSYRWAPHLTRMTRLATVIVAILAFVTLVPLANHGGKIMHSELRSSEATDGGTSTDDSHEEAE